MRKILFKGKRKDNGEWVKGMLLATDVIIPCGQDFFIEANSIIDAVFTGYEVIPETVGQYINLDDEDKKEIFEGDILKNIWTGDIHTVNWCVDCAVWVLPCITDERRETTFNSYSCDEYVIIGNVFVNPELLKGGV